MDADQRQGLREVAAGRTWNVQDVVLSDLMAKRLIRRNGIFDRVLTDKGRKALQEMDNQQSLFRM